MNQTNKEDNGIYYYLGNITSHILHALPLYQKMGGTFVVASKEAEEKLTRDYGVTVIHIDNVSPARQKQIDRIRIRLGMAPTGLTLGRNLKKTFKFLDSNARVVIFYELFQFTKHTELNKPKTVFLTHGNMLKSYMNNAGRLEAIKKYDYMAGLGPIVKKHLIEQDGVEATKFIDVGIARTDELYALKSDASLREKVAKEFGFDSSKKIVSYLPTFWGASSIYNTGKALLKNTDDSFVVLLRLHPQVPATIRQEYEQIVNERNNVFWADEKHAPSVGVPEMMCASDVILGDVSSVVLEAILVDKPLVFVYDIGEHRQSPDDYKFIPKVVGWSEHIDMDNAQSTSNILDKAINKGIDSAIWQETKSQTFYNPNGDSVKAIATRINALISR